jgi:hypothetical protein
MFSLESDGISELTGKKQRLKNRAAGKVNKTLKNWYWW